LQLREHFDVDLSVLGEGAYAAVRRLRHRQTGELVALKVVEKYPLLNHKPALMRAYKTTINSSDSNGDDWVQRKEFKMLLLVYH